MKIFIHFHRLFDEAERDKSGRQSSGYGGHSGHSEYKNDKSVGYGHSRGSGHSSGGYYGHSGNPGHSGYNMKEECCPVVVDAWCLAALLGSIAGATLLLIRTFQIELTMVGRRNRPVFGGRGLDERPLLPLLGGKIIVRRRKRTLIFALNKRDA